MSEKSRKRHSPEFKAKVAEAAIRERQSTADLSQQYRVHPTQVGQWKRQGLAALASAFVPSVKQAELQLHVEQADFIREIIVEERNLVSLNVAGEEEQIKNAEAEILIAQKQLDTTLLLREKGIISIGAVHVEQIEMLHLESRLARLATNRDRLLVEGRLQLVQHRKELSQNENQAARIEADIAQMQASESLALAEFRSGMVDMAATQSRQAHALRQEAIQAESRLASHDIVAPEAGVVEQLAVHTAGAVVQPGQALMMIVPRDARLIAEVEILNKDVGFVHEGQSVRVKVDAFNYTRYGLIDGEVMDVADDAVEREGLGAVFRMRIRLLQDEMVVEGKTVRLRPGMSVTAEVRTGERRVIDFFLDPFRRARDESLNVR